MQDVHGWVLGVALMEVYFATGCLGSDCRVGVGGGGFGYGGQPGFGKGDGGWLAMVTGWLQALGPLR